MSIVVSRKADYNVRNINDSVKKVMLNAVLVINIVASPSHAVPGEIIMYVLQFKKFLEHVQLILT